MEYVVVVVIMLALIFDLLNGLHDAGNAIATVVATKAMTPPAALIMAAALNLIGALVSTEVAQAFAGGIIYPDSLTINALTAGLIGAITWNLATWYFGIPSSSSHALVGGLTGAALVGGGMAAVNFGSVWKMVLSLFVSPLAGVAAGLALVYALRLVRWNGKAFSRLQILSAAAVAFSHGSNDAQKSMGVMTAALFATGLIGRLAVPLWAVIAAAVAMGLGTGMGGWRIVKTMGDNIVKLTPRDGFAAETAAAVVVETATWFGLPVSTTHVITSAIAAVGLPRGPGAVNWGAIGNIGWAMLLTLPASGAVGALFAWILQFLMDMPI